MAYDFMYESNGFIHKEPRAKKGSMGGRPERAVKVERIKKIFPVRGGITMFRFVRLLFR